MTSKMSDQIANAGGSEPAKPGSLERVVIPPPVLLPQPCPSFASYPCANCGEWACSGGSLCEDCAEHAMYD